MTQPFDPHALLAEARLGVLATGRSLATRHRLTLRGRIMV